MRHIPLCRVLLLFLLLLPLTVQADPIAAYTPTSRVVMDVRGERLLQLRSFTRNGEPQALLVNPVTLATSVVSAAALREASWPDLAATPYGRTLAETTRGPARLQNHGLTHGLLPVTGQFLTVDLCPSKRPFERHFFDTVASLAGARPVPVAVAITGAWLASHGEELAWLREQERTGRLAITWVNHSLTHPYDSTVPLSRTFLLTSGLDRRREVLALELQLLERGVVPSVFFRFPGLVADDGALALLRDLGLIPLGSDAWLAKGEAVRDGSIILVHGNGNEPAGIRRFDQLVGAAAGLRLLPLNQAVIGATSSGRI